MKLNILVSKIIVLFQINMIQFHMIEQKIIKIMKLIIIITMKKIEETIIQSPMIIKQDIHQI